jgi:hypothetical protein
MSIFKATKINDVELIYSLLRERYPKRQIEIEFNDNTKEYTLKLTKEEYKVDPTVPVDVNIKIVYGDSVTGDTPLLLQKDGKVYIETINSIFDEDKKVEYPGFKIFDKSIRLEKEYSTTDYQIWTDVGWVDIRKVIRHKCDKKIYRVLTHTGCVDVTEDHSLITENKQPIKPNELKVGDSLLHSFPNEFIENEFIGNEATVVKMEKKSENYKNDSPLTEKEAEVWGFFMNNGSCDEHDCKSGSWVLHNNDLERLNYFKDIMESVEPIKFEILDTLKSTGVYKLVPKGSIKYIVDKYRHLFYYQTEDGNKYKIVPNCILNASKKIKMAYWKGYSKASIKGKIGAQCMYYLMKSIGFNMSINVTNQDIYFFNAIENVKEECEIKKIIEKDTVTDYVYDLETEIGRFGAGVGQMQVSNTDSIFASIKFNRDDFEQNRLDTFKISEICGNKLTNEIFNRKPVEMEFEKVFQPFILLTKKRYIGKKFENMKDPFEMKNITSAGIALTRRDYCLMVKDCYSKVIDFIMENQLPKAIGVYKEFLDKIERYDMSVDQLIISAALAKSYSCSDCKTKCEWTNIRCLKCKTDIPRGNIIKDTCPQCSTKFICIHTFSLAHVNLASKMLRRKEEINVNDRIQYIYVERETINTKSTSKGKGDLAEEPKYAKEHNLKFNRVCYTEQLAKPLLSFFKVVLDSNTQEELIDYTNDKMENYGASKFKPSDFKLNDE